MFSYIYRETYFPHVSTMMVYMLKNIKLNNKFKFIFDFPFHRLFLTKCGNRVTALRMYELYALYAVHKISIK